jgi:hypothetical protein
VSEAILLERWAGPLLLAHGALALAAVAGATSHAWYLVRSARGAEVGPPLRLLGIALPTAFAAQMALGLVLYPVYRVRVRFAVLEGAAPHVARLFELKEHLAALSFALVVAAALAGRRAAVREKSAVEAALAALSASGAALAWAAALLGIYVTANRAVGS